MIVMMEMELLRFEKEIIILTKLMTKKLQTNKQNSMVSIQVMNSILLKTRPTNNSSIKFSTQSEIHPISSLFSSFTSKQSINRFILFIHRKSIWFLLNDHSPSISVMNQFADSNLSRVCQSFNRTCFLSVF